MNDFTIRILRDCVEITGYACSVDVLHVGLSIVKTAVSVIGCEKELSAVYKAGYALYEDPVNRIVKYHPTEHLYVGTIKSSIRYSGVSGIYFEKGIPDITDLFAGLAVAVYAAKSLGMDAERFLMVLKECVAPDIRISA